jgi:UDP-MurNAc hydroxylase
MKFQVLSHAALLVSTDNASVVVDPWLLGSCYWRSWWNFPKAQFDEAEMRNVDAVIISHVHWDHWHGPTLKAFFKGKPVYVPDEPGLRSALDLAAVGFTDVHRVPHGKSVEIGDIKLTLYQFGLLLNDAVVVLEAGGVTLLDANDAKMAGLALDNVLARHAPVDFAFRSHSSANPRVCFNITTALDYKPDDRDHYSRSFVAFMDRVKPRYAIPFASNHCHLPDDVFHFNKYICSPIELQAFVEKSAPDRHWKIQVMLPGSAWSDEFDFELVNDGSFSDIDKSLADYRQEVSGSLARTKESENLTKINESVLKRFGKMVSYRPMGKSTGTVLVSLFWPDGRQAGWRFDLGTGEHQSVDAILEPQKGEPLMRFPAAVFRDAVIRNMFHHAGISKRCQFLAYDRKDMDCLQKVFTALERHELGLYPVKLDYIGRMLRAYAARWRELFVYASAVLRLKFTRQPIYLVEEAILKGRWRTPAG